MSEFISLFLAARPSLFEGFARLFDFAGTLNEYNSSINASQADRMAMLVDIRALREDVMIARRKLSKTE